MNLAEPHHIIAIGASSGGIEEIDAFFEHAPVAGASYIVIQHMAAAFKSKMVSLLSRHSNLKIREAKHEMPVESDLVYLIPNDKFMTIKNNKLYLSDKKDLPQPHLAINVFLNSLALDAGKNAVAVVLSGLGADGAEGIKAIKKAGGLVLARDPAASNFGSMPSNAVATGFVDFILEPNLMHVAIEDYVKFGGEPLADRQEDDKIIKSIIKLIKEKSPFDFTDYKQSTILRRTKSRAAYNNFSSLGKYFEYLKTSPEEISALGQEYLISVTSFFRDPEAFEAVEHQIIPLLLSKLKPDEELKIWVAGCATGEEVYSLAILIYEQLTGEYKDTIVKIFATDVDNLALEIAGKAVYGKNIVKSITPERLAAHFSKEGDNYKVKTSVRRMVIFAQHDLVKNPPYCNMHFIACRNLLIYMTPVLQKKIFSMLLFGLKMNGYLFLGASENPVPIIKNLEVVNSKWKIYKNLESKRILRFDAFSLPELLDVKRSHPVMTGADNTSKTDTNLIAAMHEQMAKEQDYLVLCVTEQNQVVKSYGDPTRFLVPKMLTTNLHDLLPKPLSVAFNTLKTQTIRSDKTASLTGIKIKLGQEAVNTSITVSKLMSRDLAENLLMITLKEAEPLLKHETQQPDFNEQLFLDQYTLDIENELRELQNKLITSYEQLDSSNENMQTFNEELLSAYEEMQSANEEIQSVNEELDTINSNYQLKNKELIELNNDLNNYFRSNINGQLIVNNDLLLMKFSPAIVALINLLETDIGRPISNISTNFKFETITDDIKEVIKNGEVITKEIQANDGKWYQITTMPYIQQEDDKSNGAIITFNNISELKKIQSELEGLLRVNADLDHFVHIASHDMLAPLGHIEGSIDIMNQMTLTDPELTEFLNIINTSVKTFRALIKNISTIAKVEGDMIATEMVDLLEVIKEVEWSLDMKIRLSGARIITNLEVKAMQFSKKNMRSILYNLVANAIKFKGAESPVIVIFSKLEGDHVVLSVQDNGIGIPEDQLKGIFDLYGRLNQDMEGNGIGLYLAKKIVNAAGGHIKVESHNGEGSKFFVQLPAKPKPLQLTASWN